jgi:hypothetical protein
MLSLHSTQNKDIIINTILYNDTCLYDNLFLHK